MRFWAATALALVLAGCGKSEEQRSIEAAEAAVRESLKDPDSAKFGLAEAFGLFDGHVVCGAVNAKNGFGGYTGERTYMVMLGPKGQSEGVIISKDDFSDRVDSARCGFLQAYGLRKENVGVRSTPERVAKLTAEHEKFIREVVAKASRETQ